MRDQLLQQASSAIWFNGIDFGDLVTHGREGENYPFPNWSLYPTFDLLQRLDLSGKRCIDIGSGSGLVALGMKALGAEYVAAADALESKAFRIATELSGQEIDYRIVDVSDLHLQSDWLSSFDLVVSSGLMYHLISPFQLVYAAKRLVKNEGLFLLQSMTAGKAHDDGNAKFILNTYKSVNGEPTTFAAPTISGMRGLVDLGLFDRTWERTIQPGDGGFHAILSISRDDVKKMTNVTAALRKTLDFYADRDYPFGGYKLAELCEAKPQAHWHMDGLKPESGFIDRNVFDVTFPFAPRPRVHDRAL